MIGIRRSADRGTADHGWLEARYAFSFADYIDHEHMGFGPLRVLNEDRILPGGGFPPHPHRNMEIVTYVIDGALTHTDDIGHETIIRSGEVQLMSAGRGIVHGEANAHASDTLHLLQMWIAPRQINSEPSYQQREFPKRSRRNRITLLVSPDGADSSLTIDQDASLHAGLLDEDRTISFATRDGRGLWLQVITGQLELRLGETEQSFLLEAGDAAALEDPSRLELQAKTASEFLIWDLPFTGA